jgi:nicotinate-nucleotide adenylyltransferase
VQGAGTNAAGDLERDTRWSLLCTLHPVPCTRLFVIGLLGGSFDPIHNGHLSTARSLLDQLDLSEVRFVVAREQPLKKGHGASAQDRARMVDLAIVGTDRFKTETIELDRPGPSYTVDTLRGLRAREPGMSWVVLLGSDAAHDLDRWKEAAEVARLGRIVVFGRAGSAIPASPLIEATATVPAVDISATEIRDRVRQGRPINSMVPPQVAEFIRQNRLYL